MIDNYLLEYLVTFTKVQTLAKTAAELNVTQPTVTRGMQRLEEEFGVKLFDRQPNRITLTPRVSWPPSSPRSYFRITRPWSPRSVITTRLTGSSKLLVQHRAPGF